MAKKYKPYRVRWEIDVDAPNVKEAARKALEIQRDENSQATFFEVTDEVGVLHPQRWKSVNL